MRARLVWWSALLAALLAQTAFLPLFLADSWRPDLTRSLVVWIALTNVPGGGVYAAFAAGLGLDAAAGGPLGIGIAQRLLLYGLARPARGILDHTWTPLLLGPAAVLSDTLLLWILRSFAFAHPASFLEIAGVAFRQSLAEAVALPAVFLLLELATGFRTERKAAV